MPSNKRLEAAAKLYGEGESMLYAAGVYSLHEDELKDYIQASLSASSPKQMSEKHTARVSRADTHKVDMVNLEARVAAYTCSILPYIIVMVGNYKLGFKYHVIRKGLKVGDLVCEDYATAHSEAVSLLASNT